MAKPYFIPPHHNHDEVYVKIGEGGSGVTDHGLLTGLEDNDHPQYRLASEAIDHGALSGLADDDHSQYLNNARHDATARHTLGTVVPHDDHGALSGLSDNDHPQYLLAASGKAADSDKLDGLNSTDFVLASELGTSTAYTPIWTASTSNPTLGDGTLQGRYIQVGKLVVVFINFVFGSTSSFGVGNHYLSLPFEAQSSGGGKFDGFARFRDEGIANYFRIAGIATTLSSTQITLFVSLTGNDNNWTPTSPFSMASGDNLVIQLMYERT